MDSVDKSAYLLATAAIKGVLPCASLEAKIASKRCKNTGESQTSFKMAKALARRSTLSKIWGFEVVIIIGNFDVDGLAEEAAEAAAADANPKSRG